MQDGSTSLVVSTHLPVQALAMWVAHAEEHWGSLNSLTPLNVCAARLSFEPHVIAGVPALADISDTGPHLMHQREAVKKKKPNHNDTT